MTATESHPVVRAEKDLPMTNGAQNPSLSVLLAEDDPALRALLAMVLRNDGYQAIEFRNGGDLLLMTAFPDSRTHELADRLGALAVLDKPFDFDELRSAIRKLPAAPGPVLASHVTTMQCWRKVPAG